MKLVSFASLFAVAALPLTALSQQPKAYDVQLHAGVVAQEGQSNLRSPTGVGASFEVLKRLPHSFAAGPSLSVAGFPQPHPYIPPGYGCFFGGSNCRMPSPSVVRTAMLGVAGTYTLPSSDEDVAPFVLAGFGMRHLTEAPERGNDVRPYGEIGLGATAYRRFVGRIRYQATSPGSELPKWSMPITVGVTF